MKILNGKEEAYRAYVNLNSTEPYSKQIIDATETFGNAIDLGQSFTEAEDKMVGAHPGLTGFMMGSIMSALHEFHVRGQEITDWWNAGYAIPKGATGAVNPAIMLLPDHLGEPEDDEKL